VALSSWDSLSFGACIGKRDPIELMRLESETDIVVGPQLIYNLVWTFMLRVISRISTGKSG